MSDESADSEPKSRKKKASKSKSSKSSKQKSSERESAAASDPVVPGPGAPESLEVPESPEIPESPGEIGATPASNEQEAPDEHEPAPVEPAPVATIEPELPAQFVVASTPTVVEPVIDEPVKAPAAMTAAAMTAAAMTAGGAGEHGPDERARADSETLPPGWPEPAPRFVVSNVVTIILGIIAVGLVVGLVLTTFSLSNKNALESARTNALSAARTYSIDLSSYNYQHLDQDFATVESHATASFKQSFSQSSSALKSTLIRFKASSTATILASAVVTATTSRVVTLIFLSQTVTNSTQKTPTTDRTQIQMTLVNTGGHWLIDVVTIL